MNHLSTLCLVAMAALSGTPMAWADDAQNAQPAPMEKQSSLGTTRFQACRPHWPGHTFPGRCGREKNRDAQALF